VKKRLALLGPKGTFTEEAALKADPGAEKVYSQTIEDVFDSVISGRAENGIVPVENSLEGSVSATLEMLLSTDISICREVVLDINNSLLALPGVGMSDIKEVISHPHALAQCRGFLKSLPGVKTRNFPSTAEAAKEVSVKGLEQTVAIASKIAADIYGLNILKEGIQDHERNQTRFFVISLACPNVPEVKKTSIVFGLKDRPGALNEILSHFARAQVNLTKIESRPTKKSLGDYIFFIDFIGDRGDEKIQSILEAVKDLTTSFKVLGSYSTG
jgi:prephenate dehydratase